MNNCVKPKFAIKQKYIMNNVLPCELFKNYWGLFGFLWQFYGDLKFCCGNSFFGCFSQVTINLIFDPCRQFCGFQEWQIWICRCRTFFAIFGSFSQVKIKVIIDPFRQSNGFQKWSRKSNSKKSLESREWCGVVADFCKFRSFFLRIVC